MAVRNSYQRFVRAVAHERYLADFSVRDGQAPLPCGIALAKALQNGECFLIMGQYLCAISLHIKRVAQP